MNYNQYNIPERPLDPPEDTRKVVFRCRICEEPILEGDDYYEISDIGPCCEECIDNAKRYEAELDCIESDRYREED